MKKAQELETLSACAETLGPDSYLGPAIIDAIPFLEQSLKSDFVPDVAGQIRARQTQAAELRSTIEKLTTQAAQLKEANKAAQSALDRVRSDIRAHCLELTQLIDNAQRHKENTEFARRRALEILTPAQPAAFNVTLPPELQAAAVKREG